MIYVILNNSNYTLDELINFDSFITILNKITPKDTEAELLEAYELFDTENLDFLKCDDFPHCKIEKHSRFIKNTKLERAENIQEIKCC